MLRLAALALVGYSTAASADAAAGKAKFAAACAECHEAADFAGEDAKALEASIKKIIAGEQKHKSKLKLNDLEIKELADYMAKGGK